nr:unnamed protein product [Digitaria exilis]
MPDGNICACDVPGLDGAAVPDWKLGKEKLFYEDPERHVDAKLVAMGSSGRFCLVEIMTMPGVDWKECLCDDDDEYVLRLTAFRVEYENDRELTTTDHRPARSFMMRDYGYSDHWLAFWAFPYEDPPSSMALRAFSPYSLAFFLLSSASIPPPINADTTFATSSLATTTASSPNSITGDVTPTRTPTPSTSTASCSLMNWSAKCGHVTTGTPCAMDTSSEFQPQCVTKPPTARWDRTASCGTHPRATWPRPAVRDSSASSHSRTSGDASTSCSFTTQRNGTPESSRPWPTSNSCFGSFLAMLPKLTYTTEPGACPSSHAVIASLPTVAVLPRVAMASASRLQRLRGPSVHTGFPSAFS